MSYPNVPNKQLAKALFSPDEYIKYAKWNTKSFPKKIIITYQTSTLNYFRRKFRGKYARFKIDGFDNVYTMGSIGFVKMDGIGAPHAVTFFEELIALGAKEFINIGSAGGLIDNGVFVCTKAVRDEGTSHHYMKSGLYAYPDKELTNRLKETLNKREVVYHTGPSWTIDAPYRETIKEIKHYKKLGVKTVEMEASALFVVAKVRKVKIASVFVVSDVIGNKKWNPQFHKFNFKKTLHGMLDVAFDCLKK